MTRGAHLQSDVCTVRACGCVALGDGTQVLLAPKHSLGGSSWAHSADSCLLDLERWSLSGVTE